MGVLHSAFGYAGQKCSACSRVDRARRRSTTHSWHRLVEAAKALKLGPADDPETDRRARHRRRGAAADRGLSPDRRDRRPGRVPRRCGPLADREITSAPLIVADVRPGARSPRKRSSARSWPCSKPATWTTRCGSPTGPPYALTGGLYSRSPANIERVNREFRVGNLYINRPITGALVDRQPFGGFKLSGIGTKAGGPDYLLEFLLTRCVTENTMRRGFAPEDVGADEK